MTNLEHIFHSICGVEGEEEGERREGEEEEEEESQLFFFLLLRVWSDTPIATRS